MHGRGGGSTDGHIIVFLAQQTAASQVCGLGSPVRALMNLPLEPICCHLKTKNCWLKFWTGYEQQSHTYVRSTTFTIIPPQKKQIAFISGPLYTLNKSAILNPPGVFALALGTAMGSRWRNPEGARVYLGQQLVNWAQYPCERASFIQAGERPFRLNILSQQREIPQPGLRTKLLIVAPVDISRLHATVVKRAVKYPRLSFLPI